MKRLLFFCMWKILSLGIKFLNDRFSFRTFNCILLVMFAIKKVNCKSINAPSKTIYHLVTAFKIFSLLIFYQRFDYNVPRCSFLYIYPGKILLSIWICGSLSYIKSGNFLATISSKSAFAVVFSYFSGSPITYITDIF